MIVRTSAPPKIALADVSERSAGKGAGGGAAAGAATGSVACVAALFLYPGCVALMAAAGAAVGATTGAVVGKAVLDSPEVVAERRKGLVDEMMSKARQALVAAELQRRLREDFGQELSISEAPLPTSSAPDRPDSNGPAWQVEVGLSEIGAVGGIHRFGVRMAAQTRIRRSGQPAIAYDNVKVVESDTELTEFEWVADDSKALRGVLDGCLKMLAYNLALDLVQPAAHGRRDPAFPTRYGIRVLVRTTQPSGPPGPRRLPPRPRSLPGRRKPSRPTAPQCWSVMWPLVSRCV